MERRVRAGPIACSSFLWIAVHAHAQAQTASPQFEVASVRACPSQPEAAPGGRRGDGLESSPDRLHLPCQTLLSLIHWAYAMFAHDRFNPLPDIPISGGPAWINSDQFAIDAKAEMPQSLGTINGPMLRSLLEERFRLRIHSETKGVPVYAITVGKGGPKLQSSQHDCIALDLENPGKPMVEPGKPLPAVCGMSRLTGKGWEAFAVSIADFATLLSANAGRKVIDETGLSGTFDIRLDLTGEDFGLLNRTDDPGSANRPERTDTFDRIRSAVQKLGLRIDSARGTGESLVIDEAERPSEN
jgi:uncharacterized protein (TIGR03435 family)